jgi:cobalt-zinc-cadmium efflux system membrane fusion protein
MIFLCLLGFAGCGRHGDGHGEESGEHKAAPGEAHAAKHIEEANVFEFSPEAQRRAGVSVEPVRLTPVNVMLRVTGSVQPIDSRVANLRPLARGRVQQVLVKVGDRVKKDQVLAAFDNIEAGEVASQLNVARAELQRLKIQHANAKRQAERSRGLVSIGAVPAKEAEGAEAEARGLEELIRAQESTIEGLNVRLRRFGFAGAGEFPFSTVRAPFGGVVMKTEAAPGDVVDSSSVLFSVADLSHVYVEGQVYEKDLGKIRRGQAVEIRVDAYPDETFRGRIAAIKDVLDPRTRTAGVRSEVANPGGKLLLEMFATMLIPTRDPHTALTVPAESVQTVNRRHVVFIPRGELHFEAREVQTIGEGARPEIIAGLKEGEPVVVTGAFQLKSAFLSHELQPEHSHD